MEGTMGSNSWYTTLVNVTLTPTDGGCGVDEAYFRINSGSWTLYTGKIQFIADGVFNIDYYSIDTLGHTEMTNSIEVKIDTVAPSSEAITSETASGGWYNTDVSLTLSSTDGTSGLDEIFYRIDGGSWTVYTTAIAFTTEGTFTLEFYGEDNAGNDEPSETRTIQLDKTGPTWDEIPTNQVVVFGVQLQYDCNASDALSGIGSWVVNDTLNFNINALGLLTTDVSIEPGTYGLEITVTDVAGNELSAIITILQQAPIPGIPGFPAVAIMLGIFSALGLGLISHRRRKPH
jgi:hypothetical protein